MSFVAFNQSFSFGNTVGGLSWSTQTKKGENVVDELAEQIKILLGKQYSPRIYFARSPAGEALAREITIGPDTTGFAEGCSVT